MILMEVEKVHNDIRYTLSNTGLERGDKVFPIANGRCLPNNDWILHGFDFRDFMSGFPSEPHVIEDLNNSDYKPYQVRTDCGYGPIEIYYKIIKVEEKVKIRKSLFGDQYEWVEIQK